MGGALLSGNALTEKAASARLPNAIQTEWQAPMELPASHLLKPSFVVLRGVSHCRGCACAGLWQPRRWQACFHCCRARNEPDAVRWCTGGRLPAKSCFGRFEWPPGSSGRGLRNPVVCSMLKTVTFQLPMVYISPLRFGCAVHDRTRVKKGFDCEITTMIFRVGGVA